MKKLMFCLVLMISQLLFSQEKPTIEEVEKSKETKVIAAFIKNNPNHPKTPALRKKLALLVYSEGNFSPSATKSNQSKRKSNQSKSSKTERELNHILNDSSESSEAFLAIDNKSDCALVVKISGRKSYTLTIPKKSRRSTLVEKGNYTINTTVCGARYSSVKKVHGNVVISLSN